MALTPSFALLRTPTFTEALQESDEEAIARSKKLNLESKKISKKRNKYHRIDDSIRQKLIDAVTKEGQMLKTVKPLTFLASNF